VLSNTEWLAGGWPALKGMASWSYDQTGLQNFVRWDSEAGTWMEMTLSATPGVNRLLGVTDYGAREKQLGQERVRDAARAKVRASMPELVQQLHGEYQFLRSMSGGIMTDRQQVRLRELSVWYRQVYQPMAEQITFAQENGAAGSTLGGIRRELEALSEGFARQ